MDLLKYYVILTLCESRTDDLKQKYPRDAELIDRLSESDPSNSKKYLSWMFKQARSGARLEDLVPSVQFFDRNNQRFEKRDIGSYETLKDLENAVKSLGDVSKTKERVLAKSETEKIQETDDFVVLRIDSREAAQQYGKRTKWCITTHNTSYYEQYAGSNVMFYFVLRKKQKNDEFDKVAIAVYRDKKNRISKTEFFDALDTKHKNKEIISIFRDLDLATISRDAASKPKAFLARLKSKEYFDDRELASYWKTLGTGPESTEAKFQITEKIPIDRADVLRQIDPEWAKFVAGEEAKIEFEDRVEYYKNKKIHRTDRPAIEWTNGSKWWWVNGQLHRTNGPAIEDSGGTREWWIDGKQHRTDGPAIEYANGDKEWWVDDKLHRTDGPAVERADGTREWWINGNYILKRDLKKYFNDSVLRKYDKV